MLKAKIRFEGVNLSVLLGDITEQQVGIIVNAANQQLAHFGGLAAAIVRKGGSSIKKESQEYIKKYGNVKTGEVAFTKPGKLKCDYVIHAVGPIYQGSSKDSVLLRNAIWNTLVKAEVLKATSIAIPAVSSGIFGFPKLLCAEILINTTKEFIKNKRTVLDDIRFVNKDNKTTDLMTQQFLKIFGTEEEKSEETKENFKESNEKHSFDGIVSEEIFDKEIEKTKTRVAN